MLTYFCIEWNQHHSFFLLWLKFSLCIPFFFQYISNITKQEKGYSCLSGTLKYNAKITKSSKVQCEVCFLINSASTATQVLLFLSKLLNLWVSVCLSIKWNNNTYFSGLKAEEKRRKNNLAPTQAHINCLVSVYWIDWFH